MQYGMHVFPWEGDRRWQTIAPCRVGFWHSAADVRPGYRDDEFLRQLQTAEEGAVRARRPGRPRCRLCGHVAEPIEYCDQHFVWPALYKHYVAIHGLQPRPDFREHIVHLEDWAIGACWPR